MRKLFLSLALLALSAGLLAEDINAIKVVQGESSPSWFLLANEPTVVFESTLITINETTYDLTNGDVVTTFGKKPTEPVTAIDELHHSNTSQKFLHDGQLLIRKNGKTYNAVGTEL